MTTSTFNKIVRSNLNLKPWILSKNTTEIVNTCIEKIYKQIPNNFKNDLLQTKVVAAAKAENKAPIRYLRSQQPSEPPTIQAQKQKPRPNNISGERLLSAIMNHKKTGGATNFAANKKLLKSANFKIYGSRRFGSSASSSSASIFRRFDERRRNRLQQQTGQMIPRRCFGLSGNAALALNSTMAKILMPARNQHMQSQLGSVPQAIEMSNSIQRDLMMIDNVLKDRISVAKAKLTKLSPEMRTRHGPFGGWEHPPALDISARHHERSAASAELKEQNRKLKQAHKQFDNLGLTMLAKRRTRLEDSFRSDLKEVSRNQQNRRSGSSRTPSIRGGRRAAGGPEKLVPASQPPTESKPADSPKRTVASTAVSALASAAAATGQPLLPNSGRYNHLSFRANRF